MTFRWAACCILLFLAVFLAGCTHSVTFEPAAPFAGGGPGTDISTANRSGELVTPLPPAPENAILNTSSIPLLLTSAHWEIAHGCGWTEENIHKSAALFLDNCRVKNLLDDGWTIKGMQYDVNILGNRCRGSTHQDAPKDCDWCADAGPTLVLTYKGVLETELMADIREGTVTPFRTTLPEGAGSVSTPGSDTIMFRNGTVLYTFRSC